MRHSCQNPRMGALSNLILIVLFSTFRVKGLPYSPYNPDAGLNIYQLVEKHGYPLETHEVTTEDGYILTLHRIPYGKGQVNSTVIGKPVIFMMHGIISSSTDWINVGPGKSLAYILADQGYDIWMGNARGNADSRKHKILDPDKDKKAFWDFSWHEIGYYDLPAMIEYSLKETHQKQLQYVGFSQGTTTFLVMASTRPESNSKIKFCTLLAPVAQMAHVKNGLIKAVVPFETTIQKTLQLVGLYEILPRSKLLQKISMGLCRNGMPTQEICKQFVFSVAGKDRKQLDGGFIPVITTNYPAGSSLKQFIHFMQIVKGPFRQFDYRNSDLNMKHYGSPEPPKYDLSKITSPVAIYYGINDLLASDTDAKLIAAQTPNVEYLKEVEYAEWTHFDFIWAKDVADILYKDVVSVIMKHN